MTILCVLWAIFFAFFAVNVFILDKWLLYLILNQFLPSKLLIYFTIIIKFDDIQLKPYIR